MTVFCNKRFSVQKHKMLTTFMNSQKVTVIQLVSKDDVFTIKELLYKIDTKAFGNRLKDTNLRYKKLVRGGVQSFLKPFLYLNVFHKVQVNIIYLIL